MTRALLLAALLPGCASLTAPSIPLPAQYGGTPPLVTARENASASMVLIACPIRADGGQVIAELIQNLAQQSPVVTASEAGSARLVLNLCPSLPDAAMVRAAADAARARGGR